MLFSAILLIITTKNVDTVIRENEIRIAIIKQIIILRIRRIECSKIKEGPLQILS